MTTFEAYFIGRIHSRFSHRILRAPGKSADFHRSSFADGTGTSDANAVARAVVESESVLRAGNGAGVSVSFTVDYIRNSIQISSEQH